MKIVIDGPPIPKNRHKCGCTRDRHPFAYDPQIKSAMQPVREKIISEWTKALESENNEIKLEALRIVQATSLIVRYTFMLPTGDSAPNAQKNAKFWRFQSPNHKPDFDNLIKFYNDCANTILWSDDKIITDGGWSKEFSETPKTVITIMPKKELIVDKNVEEIIKAFSPLELVKFANDCKRIKKIVGDNLDNYFEEMEIHQQELFLTELAILLSDFSNNYYENIKKIKKIGSIKDLVIENQKIITKNNLENFIGC
jgi:Holliday junction resolvase RusA-like endonuclease